MPPGLFPNTGPGSVAVRHTLNHNTPDSGIMRVGCEESIPAQNNYTRLILPRLAFGRADVQ